jgi:hypothetical protein
MKGLKRLLIQDSINMRLGPDDIPFIKAFTKGFSWTQFLRVRQLAYRRRLFCAGRDFMGLGPEHLEVGDIIVVLLGGPTPYILRPVVGSQEQYILIGECYVFGLMNCEGLQHVQDMLRQKGFHIPHTGPPRCTSPLEIFTLV